MTNNRPLRVFLCHSSNDKPAVRELYQKLRAEPWIQPWLDEEELYPGDDWDLAIEKTVEESDVVLVCLSNSSINKRGYVQKELRFALDIALEIPEEEVFIIPLRLEECTPPRSLRDWQYADYFEGKRENAHQRLLISLKRRADSLGLKFEKTASQKEEKPNVIEQNATQKYLEDFHKKFAKPLSEYKTDKLTLSNGMEFMRVPAGKFIMGSDDHEDEFPQHTVDIPYDCWMGRFPVTNVQFGQFRTINFGKGKENHPVVDIMFMEIQDYMKWLNGKNDSQVPKGYTFRLPSEAEWEKAARGEKGLIFPWGNEFDKIKCNSSEGGKDGVTPVGLYSPQGDSPYGCGDMAGNVWELTHSLWGRQWEKPYYIYPYKANDGREDETSHYLHVLRGSSYDCEYWSMRCTRRLGYVPPGRQNSGFRVCIAPSLPK